MSQLPKGWVETKLINVGNTVTGNTPARKNPEFYGDCIPFVKPGDIDVDKEIYQTEESLSELGGTVARVLKKGSVLVTCIGNIGRVGLAMKSMATNQQINAVEFNELISPKYAFYYCRTLSGWLNFHASATTVAIINKSKFSEAPFKLAPLAEQTRIVEKLDEVLAQVDTIKARLDGIPAILKRFRQSVLAAAVSGKLTEEWRGKNVSGCAESELNANFSRKSGKLKLRGKQANLNELSLLTLPSSWTWTQNYKLAKDASNAICAGPFGTIFKAKDFRDEGVPIIFLRHVKEDGFNQHKPNYMDRAVWEELHQEYSVHGGELLVTKLGDPPGECCIYPENTGTSMVTPDVLKMDVDEQSAEKKYLRSYFNSPISTEIIEKLAFGATRLRIDIAMFKAFPVPLPPMEEQKEIVRLVDQYFAFADTIEAQVKKAQARVDKLTQSILAKAFRGELVPQDPNDEPADKLLERIALARKEAEVLAKAAKKAAKK